MNTGGNGRPGNAPGADELVAGLWAAPDLAAAPLIVTKLMAPAPPPGVIRRDRLHRLLDSGAGSKLTLGIAPAGYGKTVLAASWLSSVPGRRAAWVSLDSGDNEPSRFWAYVLAAIAGAGTGLQLPATPVGQAGTGPPHEALVPLVNALAGLTSDLVLVLDDYHLITDERIHADVAFLLDRQPPRLHLLILSRADPPFPLARRTASGELTQARTRDLAFTAEEMTLFLDRQDVALPAALRPALFARLGGWAAALRLLTLWVAGRDDPAAAVAEFTASDATIADYLTTEILGQLPAGLRRFLLQTSILPRLTGPLCDAVTGGSGGAQTLAELDRRGLFTEALAPRRDWFRYHQLFAELLRLDLHRDCPELIDNLHRRASRWFAAHGFAADAIDHGLAARDWTGVQALMISEMLAIGSRYQPAAIEAWLSALPAQIRQASPFLRVLDGLVHAYAGRFTDAGRALDQAQDLAAAADPPPSFPELPAIGHAVRAGIARLTCDLPAARAAALAVDRELRRAGAAATPLARLSRAAATGSLAVTTFWHGDFDRAGRLLRAAEIETADYQQTRMRVNTVSATALLLATTGQLRQATALAAEALELAEPVGTDLFQTTPALLATALVCLHRADHAQARRQLAAVAERARRHQDPAPLLTAGILLARLTALAGDPAAAFAALDDANAASPRWQPPAALRALATQEEARLCLLSGDIAAARALHTRLLTLRSEASAVDLAIRLTQARILLAEGDAAAASDWFDLAASTALSGDQLPDAVEALTGAAVANGSAGRLEPALSCLERALTLACDETIVAPFIGQAAGVRPLLLAMERGPGEYAALGLRQRLLAGLGIPARLPSPETSRAAAAAGLSDRELTILRLLHGTLTGPEIAAALAVSPNTLKTHLRHIYRKLGISSRQQAITRSRELGLR
jgi:LuxR family transcriptional regulator, maltose regulon positive regulatory protein